MEKIQIYSFEDYKNIADSILPEFDPLVNIGIVSTQFDMPIEVRIEIQNRLFKQQAGIYSKYYRWVWEHKPKICEETSLYLNSYSSAYVSHILTKGAHPELALDPRNSNILSFYAHQIWETGMRKNMAI